MKQLLSTCLLALTVSACASFSPYSISEGTLENHLARAINDFDRQQLQAGSPLSVTLNDADITLGPDGRDVAVIDIDGQIAVNALMTKIPVDVFLKVEGAPVYDASEKAIFIRRLQLLDSRVESNLFNQDLKPLTDTVMRAVAQLLETVPVYRLDESDARQRLFGMVPMDIRVAPGRIELVMDEQKGRAQ
ncbi:DUF1439 domain-containing protein [Marinobacter xestospongiae]|uniref:DUF1439 domain-containing protein n=1 Tax=Marinobacter xestospongiae TaxID=994319 RepID=UPI002004F80A|nr:DUF1439 domain-containing protein [Marinobacter xestospongiae]MCK7567286.1 DUF1439 domain-containing protein [Marinobacter xestospongiae]